MEVQALVPSYLWMCRRSHLATCGCEGASAWLPVDVQALAPRLSVDVQALAPRLSVDVQALAPRLPVDVQALVPSYLWMCRR